MSIGVPLDHNGAARRRRNSQATRATILTVAKALFAHRGYDSTSMREIAAAASVDVALVNRYFGGKEGLFVEALKASFHPDRLGAWDRASFGRDLATRLAHNAHSDEEGTNGFQFLLRAATSPGTAPLLSSAMQERFMAPFRAWLGGPHVEVRARILAATFIGFLAERLVRDAPLEGEEREQFITRTTALFEALVTETGPSARPEP